MPGKPRKPCSTPGCHGLTAAKYCGDCLSAGKAREIRPNSYQRGYNREWNEYSRRFIAGNRFCSDPLKIHLIPAIAEVVDHKIPHKGNQELFWNPANHQSLCAHCHNVKTATEDGGFGHARRK